MEQKKWKNKNFLEALLHSFDGIKYAFQKERNLKIQSIFAILAIGTGIFLKLTQIEVIALFITIGFVLFAELMNTVIEVMLDLYSEEYNKKIKLAKDIASGAVLMTSMISIMVGVVMFLPKILNKLN